MYLKRWDNNTPQIVDNYIIEDLEDSSRSVGLSMPSFGSMEFEDSPIKSEEQSEQAQTVIIIDL